MYDFNSIQSQLPSLGELLKLSERTKHLVQSQRTDSLTPDELARVSKTQHLVTIPGLSVRRAPVARDFASLHREILQGMRFGYEAMAAEMAQKMSPHATEVTTLRGQLDRLAESETRLEWDLRLNDHYVLALVADYFFI